MTTDSAVICSCCGDQLTDADRIDADRDEVLRCFGHPLPVPVLTRLDEQWAIERTAGMAARVLDNASQFAGHDRNVHTELLSVPSGRTPAESLAWLLADAPHAGAAQQLTEDFPGGLRHASWLTSTVDGRVQHTLHGLVIRDSAVVAPACMYRNAQDLTWAQHVWRSVTHTDPPTS